MAAHLGDLAHLDGAAVEVGVEQRHARRRPRRLLERRRAGQDQHLLGDLRGRGPDLAAGDDVAVALAHRARLEPGRVEPGIGLGHREAGLFPAGDQRRQKAPLLLVGAEDDDRVQPEDVHVHRRGAAEPGPRLRDRLHDDRRLGDAEPAAAIFLRHRDAEPAAFGHRPVEFVREAAVGVLLQPVIVAEALAQPRHRVADLQLLGGQGEGHRELLKKAPTLARSARGSTPLELRVAGEGGMGARLGLYSATDRAPEHAFAARHRLHRLPARLPERLRAGGRAHRRRAHRPGARRRGAVLHAGRGLRQGRALCRAPAPSRRGCRVPLRRVGEKGGGATPSRRSRGTRRSTRSPSG